jgi:glutaredoxin-like YruB-family protein
MRNAWLAALVAFCLVTGGWILVQDRAGAGESAFASVLAEEAQEALAEVKGAAGGPAEDAEREPATFYRYTDESGSVRFVTSLADVPARLRDRAQPVTSSRVQRAPAAATKPAPRVARAARPAAAERALARNKEVVVYTTSWCGWCRKTLAYLDQNGVDYENRDIEADDAWREELEEKTGSTSIPVVEIDGEIIRGYDPGRMRKLLESS